MRRFAVLLSCLALAAVFTPAARAARIVSLAPHLTEMLYAAGAGDRLVGTVEYSDYPATAAALPRVGSAFAVDLEAVARLKPDLVLAWASGTPPHVVQGLRRLGLKVDESRVYRLAEVPGELERLGRLAGTAATASAAAAGLRVRIDGLRRHYAGRPPLKVFYQLWNTPLYTIGGGHFIADVLGLCGGRNLFADLDAIAATVEREAVLARQPDVILMGADAGQAQVWFNEWRRQPAPRAVKAGRIAVMPPDLLHRPGPRLVDGAERLCLALESWRGQ